MTRVPAARGVAKIGGLVLAIALLAGCAAGAKAPTNSGSDALEASALAEAKSIIDSRLAQPTELPISEAITTGVPKDKRISLISCGPTPECAEHAALAKQATDALGWKLKTIPSDGSPEAVRAAFEDVVRDKPDGVLFMAIDFATYSTFAPQLKANGTFIAACCTVDDPGAGMDYLAGTPDQFLTGETMAAWILAKTGKATDILYADVSAFSILTPQKTQFQKTIDTLCKKCEVEVLDIPFSAFGVDVPTRIVSALRANPKIKYVAVATDGLVLGLPAALRAAGLKDIKIVGESPVQANLDLLRTGDQESTVMFADAELIWLMIDAIARNEAGVAQVDSTYPAPWIVDGKSAPAKKGPVVKDSLAQFLKLWGVS